MSTGRLAPTRSTLLRSRTRLERVARGIDLLTRKRRALAAELFDVAVPAIEARARVNECAAKAYPALLEARALHGGHLAALGWPERPVEVEVERWEAWGVASGTVRRLAPVQRTLLERNQAPGLTAPAVAAAATGFERLVELLLDSASTELLLRRLAEALKRTSRQVNTLEQRVAPGLRTEVRRVRALLEEREREDHARLKHLRQRRAAPTAAARPQ